jgi:hypothetical protein
VARDSVIAHSAAIQLDGQREQCADGESGRNCIDIVNVGR